MTSTRETLLQSVILFLRWRAKIANALIEAGLVLLGRRNTDHASKTYPDCQLRFGEALQIRVHVEIPL